MAPTPVGLLFPAGGRVEPAQMIGRVGDVQDLVETLLQHVHVAVTGRRRIGKTTVCHAACARLRDEYGFIALEVETPEQSTAAGFAELIASRYARESLRHAAREGAQRARPVLETAAELLLGVKPDLSPITDPQLALDSRRAALELPLALTRETGKRVVLFLDELQRAVDYGDGLGLVNDLVDVYANQREVVVLVDGSDERTLDALLGHPHNLAKLTVRRPLAERIPADQWRHPLRDRFAEAGLRISEVGLDELLAFGDGRPYATMCAARHVALVARTLQLGEVDEFALRKGVEEARAHLASDA